MHKFFAVTKTELYRYFISPLAYVYLLAFLFLNASFTLYLGHFLERGEAVLDVMFAFLPWIYLIFISGIAMRLWAEEFKTQTITQLLSLPVRPITLVCGKFCAAWLFCTIGLFLTFPFVIVVNILGQPDNAVIACGYFACFLLSGAMLAVAQTMSALTKNQVIALVLSVLVNLLFFLSGIEYVLGFFRTFLPFELVEHIADLSFLTNFNDICSGQLRAYNILFFISIILAFNFITEILIRAKTSGATSRTDFSFLLSFIFLWCGFIGFNFLAQDMLQTAQWDMTSDKRFSISRGEQKILTSIQEPVTIKIYYSTVLSQRNPLFRKAVNHLRFLMKTYRRESRNKLSYRFYYPELFNNAEDMALHDNMIPIPLPDLNQNAFFGISIVDEGGRQKSIPFIPLENLDKLGTEILQNIYELSHTKPTVGILSSLPLFGLNMDNHTVGSQWKLVDEIEKLYRIKQIANPEDLSNIDVLLIIHPRDLSEQLTEAIKQYTLTGGKIVLLADLAAESQRLYSPVNQRFTPSNLNGLDQLWGFNFNSDVTVADLANSITVNTGSKNKASFAQDIIQFMIDENGINRTQPETKNLSQFLFASATQITPRQGHPSTFIPLLQTSRNSALLPSFVVYQNMNPANILPQFKADDTNKIIAAKIVGHDQAHPFKIIVIGDSDFAYDDFWSRFKMFEEHQYAVFLNDNAHLVLNALDSLSGYGDLIDLRRLRNFSPKFDKWELLRKQNALTFAFEERAVLDQINDIKISLNNLWQKKNFEERQDFSDDELNIIADFRQSLRNLKQRLSTLKLNQNANIKRKQAFVVFLTLYAVPLTLILLLLGYVVMHRPKAKYTIRASYRFHPSVLTAAAICSVLFIGGIITVFYSADTGNDFENHPVFPDWKNQLNQIQKIQLEQNHHQLTFYKKDGQWFIEGAETYPVYQRRIINLLSVLADARYLERKSARAEYLPKFGLDDAHATRLTLSDGEGHSILDFNIGQYDEEIGRGGRGAYLKFNNRFQVWLIDADFISLSTDWRDWSMNTALNPRFGRLKDIDEIKDQDIQIILLKELYNTPLTVVTEIPSESTILKKLALTFENDDRITIYFEKNGNKNYIHYSFDKTQGAYLKLFADFATGKYYEIPKKNMENLNNVFNLFN